MPRPLIGRASINGGLELQTGLLVLGAMLYWWYSLRFVEGDVYRPVVGTVAAVLAYVVAGHLGPNRRPGREPVIAFAVTMLVFVMPVAGGPAPRGHGFAAAAFGSFVAQGSWALFRYPFEPTRSASAFLREPLLVRIKNSAGLGGMIAVGLTLFAAFLILIVVLVSPEARSLGVVRDVLYLAAGYVGAGIVGGAVVGAAAPLVRWPLGAMVLGIPLTGAIYGSVAFAMARMTVLFDETDVTAIPPPAALVILVWIGPMWGIMIKEWIEE